MPRAGGTYTLPFPDTVPNTTIESVKYNSTNHDIEFDLNQPRPISAGGTGGTSGDSALASLNAEKSTQIVADYNTMAFLPGSFASIATALNGPVNGHNFAGICYSSDPLPTAPNFVVTNNNLVLEARDLDDGLIGPPLTVPGTVYVRQKKAGVWGVWTKAGGLGVAPFDALAYNGMQINGSTEVSQEVGSTGVNLVATGTAYRPCDGWIVWVGQAVGAVNVGVSRVAGLGGLPGFGNAVAISANNNNFTNATSGDYLFYQQGIEGYRTSRLGWGAAGAMPLSYGFWFNASVSGVIHVRLTNSAQDRHYYQEHTVVAGWQWLTATTPGDTAGTWLKDNNVGCYISINVAGKETTPATPGVWTAGGVKRQTTNSTNLMGTSGNQTYITGLIVIPGTQVPSSASSSLIMRPYDQELQTCMRYWQKLTINDTIWIGDGNAYQTSFPFDPMRSTPSINSSGLATGGGTSLGGYPQYSVNANSFIMSRALSVAATIQTISGTVILDARL